MIEAKVHVMYKQLALTYKQKVELAINYMKAHDVNFGNEIANERAVEMYVDGLSFRELQYQNTIDEFKNLFLNLQKEVWDEMYKYMTAKLNEKESI